MNGRQIDERGNATTAEIFATMLSRDGNVTGWNIGAERLTGYRASDIVGRPFAAFVPTELASTSHQTGILKRAAAQGSASYSDWHIRNDGSQFWASVNVTAMCDQLDEILAFSVELRLTTPPSQTAEKLRARNVELEEQLGERTAQLGARTEELGIRTDELGSQTTELGERTTQLGERTTQLGERTTELKVKTNEFNTIEALNKELEAFTYAASHDLRAPLRSIDGFSLALLEDYGATLDPEAKNYLDRIRACAQRMGHLIDDLIGLSSLTRANIDRSPCDLSQVGLKIATELQRTKPDRYVVFDISKPMVAECDVRLMRIVLENLLGNAFKYTSKLQSAKIEMGSQDFDTEVAYFVRDNGAGFDMKYAHKLFGPFQRLHGMHEFEGNGIGLATVQRIINRHGGRVWAQSEVNKGTTVFFTL